MALASVMPAMWVSQRFFHTGKLGGITFLKTLITWHASHIYGTNIPLAHSAVWHETMVAVIIFVLVAAYVLVFLGLSGVKKTGKFMSGSQTSSAGKRSDDPAKMLPFKAKAFKAYTPQSVIAQDQVRPSKKKVPTSERRLEEYGFIAGYANGDPNSPIVFSSELSVLVTGEPRSGKTGGLVIPWVMSWQGPVITTSTRNEVLRTTHLARKRISDSVYVLAVPGVEVPEGIGMLAYDICWFYRAEWKSLINAAQQRADIFAGVTDDKNNPVWGKSTKENFSCLLLIAFAWRCAQMEISGGTLSQDKKTAIEGFEFQFPRLKNEQNHIEVLKHLSTMGWAGDEIKVECVIKFLSEFIPGGAGAAVAHYVRSSLGRFEGGSMGTEFANTVKALSNLALGKLNDPQIAAMFSTPPNKPVFDPDTFLEESGTLYIISRESDSSELAAFFSLMVNEISNAARRRAARMGRCDPGLALILDEVANIAPLPNLRTYMSEGGGNGITTVAILQSRRQLETVYGEVKARDIESSANVLLNFGGTKNLDDLKMFAAQAGTEVKQFASYDSAGKLTGRSEQVQAVLEPEQIANLPTGWMLAKMPRTPMLALKSVFWDGPPKLGKENPLNVHRWRREWGGPLTEGNAGYPFHGVNRALSYQAARELGHQSTLIPVVELEIEMPEPFKAADEKSGEDEPVRSGVGPEAQATTNDETGSAAQEPKAEADDDGWGAAKPTRRKRSSPKGNPPMDGVESLFASFVWEQDEESRRTERSGKNAAGGNRGLFDTEDEAQDA